MRMPCWIGNIEKDYTLLAFIYFTFCNKRVWKLEFGYAFLGLLRIILCVTVTILVQIPLFAFYNSCNVSQTLYISFMYICDVLASYYLTFVKE